jgi:hypothetical protein
MTFITDDCTRPIDDTPFFTPPPANAGGRDGADRGPLADLLVSLAGHDDIVLPAGIAGRFRRVVTGAIWEPDAVRATTDLARGLAGGRAVVLAGGMLDRLSARIAFGPASGLGEAALRDRDAARLAAGLVILAFAAGQAGCGDAAHLRRDAAGLTVGPMPAAALPSR